MKFSGAGLGRSRAGTRRCSPEQGRGGEEEERDVVLRNRAWAEKRRNERTFSGSGSSRGEEERDVVLRSRAGAEKRRNERTFSGSWSSGGEEERDVVLRRRAGAEKRSYETMDRTGFTRNKAELFYQRRTDSHID